MKFQLKGCDGHDAAITPTHWRKCPGSPVGLLRSAPWPKGSINQRFILITSRLGGVARPLLIVCFCGSSVTFAAFFVSDSANTARWHGSFHLDFLSHNLQEQMMRKHERISRQAVLQAAWMSKPHQWGRTNLWMAFTHKSQYRSERRRHWLLTTGLKISSCLWCWAKKTSIK